MSNHFIQRQQIAQGLIPKPEKVKKVHQLKRTPLKPKGMPRPTKKKKEGLPLQELLALAPVVVNKWIRNRDKGKPCVTCGKDNPKEAGHYLAAGSYSGVRFDPMNIHLQCNDCNCYKGSNNPAYKEAMLRMYGPVALAELELKAKATKKYKWSRQELEDIIEKHKI